MHIVSIVSALLFSGTFVSAESPCQCTFTSADDPTCVAYGQLGDGVLIPWSIASQECLDLFKIKDEAIDPESLANMFPNR